MAMNGIRHGHEWNGAMAMNGMRHGHKWGHTWGPCMGAMLVAHSKFRYSHEPKTFSGARWILRSAHRD